MWLIVLLIVPAYLLGAAPFGLLIAKANGIDLRKVGSGNIGATNVSRALGRKWAYICFVLDAGKGLLPMLVVHFTGFSAEPITAGKLTLWLLVGCAAILGHIFPVYLRFKGGKGVSTCLGVVLGLWPYYTLPGLIAFLAWALALWLWRYVSLASILAAAVFPLALIALTISIPEWEFAALWPLVVIAVLMPLLIIARHAENIKRLLEGSETKIG